MKLWSGFLVTTLLLSSAMAANAQQVTVTGCPVSGAVQGCIMIRGADNVTYNITESKQKPEFGKNAIRATGATSKKASYCAQGVALTNITWSYTNQPCR